MCWGVLRCRFRAATRMGRGARLAEALERGGAAAALAHTLTYFSSSSPRPDSTSNPPPPWARPSNGDGYARAHPQDPPLPPTVPMHISNQAWPAQQVSDKGNEVRVRAELPALPGGSLNVGHPGHH